MLPHVVTVEETQDVLSQVDKLLVVWIVEIRDNRHSIIQLEPEGEDRVVDEDDVLELAVPNDSQIFDKYAFISLEAVIPIQPEVNQRTIRIDQVDNSISIFLVACSENADLIPLSTLSEALSDVRPQIDPCLDDLFDTAIGGLAHDFDFVLGYFAVLVRELRRVPILRIQTVRQRLIQVEYQRLHPQLIVAWERL